MLLLFGFVRVQNVRNGGNGWLCRLLHFKIDELYVIFRYAHEITPFHLIQKTRRLDLECNDFSQIQILNNKISLVSSTVGISQNAEFFNIFIYKNASATDAKTNMVKCFSGIFTWNFPPRCISSMVHRSLVISYSNRKSQALFTQHTHNLFNLLSVSADSCSLNFVQPIECLIYCRCHSTTTTMTTTALLHPQSYEHITRIRTRFTLEIKVLSSFFLWTVF